MDGAGGVAEGGGPASAAGSAGELEQAQAAKQQQKQQEEQKQQMLHSLLENSARERLERIKLVKPEKARSVESKLLSMAQRGALTERVSEQRLISLLNSASSGSGSESSRGPTVERKRPSVFDDDD